MKDALRVVLDPLTQPLSWILEGALYLFQSTPWFIMVPLLALVVYFASKSIKLVGFRCRMSYRLSLCGSL